jgi:hypothetical protein
MMSVMKKGRARHAPGKVRDAIVAFLRKHREARVADIVGAVEKQLGEGPRSSIRSYLNLDKSGLFEKVRHGVYRLKGGGGDG